MNLSPAARPSQARTRVPPGDVGASVMRAGSHAGPGIRGLEASVSTVCPAHAGAIGRAVLADAVDIGRERPWPPSVRSVSGVVRGRRCCAPRRRGRRRRRCRARRRREPRRGRLRHRHRAGFRRQRWSLAYSRLASSDPRRKVIERDPERVIEIRTDREPEDRVRRTWACRAHGVRDGVRNTIPWPAGRHRRLRERPLVRRGGRRPGSWGSSRRRRRIRFKMLRDRRAPRTRPERTPSLSTDRHR